MSLLRGGIKSERLSSVNNAVVSVPLYDNTVRIEFRSGLSTGLTNLNGSGGAINQISKKYCWAIAATAPPAASDADVQYWGVQWYFITGSVYTYQNSYRLFYGNEIKITLNDGNNRPEADLNIYFWQPPMWPSGSQHYLITQYTVV